MQANKLPVSEMQRLMQGVAAHGEQHLLEAEADLAQTSFLLAEAITQLSASFLHINGCVATAQAELDQLLAQGQLPAASARLLRQQREAVAHEVGQVVTGLQFQDLTNQLIARTLKRLEGLRDVFSVLSGHAERMPGEDEHGAVADLLSRVNEHLHQRSGELQAGLRKEVNQKHMACGDIDLF